MRTHAHVLAVNKRSVLLEELVASIFETAWQKKLKYPSTPYGRQVTFRPENS